MPPPPLPWTPRPRTPTRASRASSPSPGSRDPTQTRLAAPARGAAESAASPRTMTTAMARSTMSR
ncbi:hypothetical protein QJS04_geneDACA021536 [Acorus gramineus]|uniref:Uncharacterized protein n=1 Tax=Acorus gramineus TaxID=55184 RepID=A0AAV9B5I8_ACOGR|nr:hypothetical protein QJS04_geneDACA021536 [Acorus gramineus]